jgi:hypothetical protein
MTAPALTIYVNGQTSPVSGDGLNTFMQTANTVSDARNFIGTTGLQIYLRGMSSIDDNGQGTFYWNATSTSADDGVNVIRPNGAVVGAWIRLSSDFDASTPPPIGNTTPNTGAFTTLTLSGSTGTLIMPIGNAELLAVSSVTGTTRSATYNEILFAIDYVSNTGSAASVPDALNKVAFYAAIQAQPGSGNVWAGNTLLQLQPGACTIGGAQIHEFDLNNNSGVNFGDTAGVAGVVQPAVFGFQVTGLSANRATAAMIVLGNLTDGTSPMWNRGLAFANGSVAQVTIADYTDSTTSIEIRGTHPGYAIDLSYGTFTTAAVRLGNAQALVALNHAGGANMQLLATDTSNNVYLGDDPGSPASALNTYIYLSASSGVLPAADNVISLGKSGARYTSVWSVNGTIQTSDPSLKTNMRLLAHVDTGAIIDAIAPITYQWKDGKRTHWGFDAESLQQVGKIAGMDFAGYVLGEDGIHAHRPDQLTPIIWEENRRLRARVAALEAKVA